MNPSRPAALSRDAVAEVFGQASYNPLLASSPATSVDNEVLARAPGEAQFLCKAIARTFRYDETTLPEWLWGGVARLLAEEPELARWPLLYAVMVNHELRHHLDIYGTSLGSHFISALGQEYRLLAAAVDADARGHGKRTQWIDRHRLLTAFRTRLYGRGSVHPDEIGLPFEEVPITATASIRARDIPIGTQTWPLLTLHRDEIEWAISVTGLLEARALVEATAFAQGRLMAAGADQEVLVTAARLLFRGLDRSPDWYWGIFAALQDGSNSDELAQDWLAVSLTVFAAAWYALNGPPPIINEDPSKPFPVLRFAEALARLVTLASESPGRWFDAGEVHGYLAAFLGDPVDLQERENGWLFLLARFSADTSFGDGLARQHLDMLSRIGVVTVAARNPRGNWANCLSGYESDQGRAIGVNLMNAPLDGLRDETTAPNTQARLLAQSRRVSRRPYSTDGDLAVVARELFRDLPRPFDPDCELYGDLERI